MLTNYLKHFTHIKNRNWSCTSHSLWRISVENVYPWKWLWFNFCVLMWYFLEPTRFKLSLFCLIILYYLFFLFISPFAQLGWTCFVITHKLMIKLLANYTVKSSFYYFLLTSVKIIIFFALFKNKNYSLLLNQKKVF